MTEYKPPETIFKLTDEAFDLVNNRIDILRERLTSLGQLSISGLGNQIKEEMAFLKDLRDLLKMSVNFEE